MKPPVRKKLQTNEDYLNHYLKYKKFLFYVLAKDYPKSDFEAIKKKTDEYLERFKYIYDNIPNDLQKLSFKSDTTDHIQKLSNYQSSTVNKTIIEELLNSIKEYGATSSTSLNSTSSLNKSENDPTSTLNYGHIFTNNGYKLWVYLMDNFIKNPNDRGFNADVSFYYHSMSQNIPKYIIANQENFIDWLLNWLKKEKQTECNSFSKIRPYWELKPKGSQREKNFEFSIIEFNKNKSVYK